MAHHRHHHRRRRCRRSRCRRRRRCVAVVRVHRPAERSFFPLIVHASVASHSAAFPSLDLHGLVNVQRLLAFLAIWRFGSAAGNDEGAENRERSTKRNGRRRNRSAEMIRTVRRGPLKSSSVVGSPGGHHGDVLGVKGGGRGEARVRVSGVRMGRVRMRMRVRVAGMRTHGGGGSRSRGRGSARVAGERVVRGVRLHAMLPRGRGLLPFVSKEMSWCVSQGW
jgi:hypothetical protein